MALSPARYSHSLLPPVPPPPMVNREPTPKQDTSDNDGISLHSIHLFRYKIYITHYVVVFVHKKPLVELK